MLEDLGMDTTSTTQHEAVFTVSESGPRPASGEIPGGHCKNLFLKGQEGRALAGGLPGRRMS